MLRYLYGRDLPKFPLLAETMFVDRARQFRDRLKWEVTVDALGQERDAYDELNPLYVIWETEAGRHGGSMRFLPTTGPTMARDHFSHLGGNEDIKSPFIWECTRFCLAPGARGRIAAALMLGGGELMRAFEVTHFLGIFDARMTRIYTRIGSSPDILGRAGQGAQEISLGLWGYSDEDRAKLIATSGVSSALSESWFERSFGRLPGAQLEVAV